MAATNGNLLINSTLRFIGTTTRNKLTKSTKTPNTLEKFSNQTTSADLSESEIKMMIQTLIDETGSVQRAGTWISHKITDIYLDMRRNGKTALNMQSREDWDAIERYFIKYRKEIERAQKVPCKFWP